MRNLLRLTLKYNHNSNLFEIIKKTGIIFKYNPGFLVNYNFFNISSDSFSNPGFLSRANIFFLYSSTPG